MGKITKEVLLIAHEKDTKERQELVSEMLDRRVKAILRQINSLSMCGNIAPMLGLLGTVTGMVDALIISHGNLQNILSKNELYFLFFS